MGVEPTYNGFAVKDNQEGYRSVKSIESKAKDDSSKLLDQLDSPVSDRVGGEAKPILIFSTSLPGEWEVTSPAARRRSGSCG